MNGASISGRNARRIRDSAMLAMSTTQTSAMIVVIGLRTASVGRLIVIPSVCGFRYRVGTFVTGGRSRPDSNLVGLVDLAVEQRVDDWDHDERKQRRDRESANDGDGQR